VSELVKEAKLDLNGKTYILKFNFKTILNFEKTTGKNFFKLGGEFSGTDLITLLWAMLISADNKVTIDEIAQITDFVDINKISKVIGELTNAGMPYNKERAIEAEGGKNPLEQMPQS
jgi:hypothetical protein